MVLYIHTSLRWYTCIFLKFKQLLNLRAKESVPSFSYIHLRNNIGNKKGKKKNPRSKSNCKEHFFIYFMWMGYFYPHHNVGCFYVNSEEFEYIIINLYFLLQQSVTVNFNSVTVYYNFIIEQNEIMKRKISFYAKVMVTERTVTVTIRTIAFLFLVPVISRKWHLTDNSSTNDEMLDKVQ